MAAVLCENLRYFYSSCFEGVDHTLPGNGGIECYNFLTVNQRLADTCSYLMIIFVCLAPVAQRRLTFPKESLMNSGDNNAKRHKNVDGGKTLLLIALCLTFGIELGYKLATKQLIYTLNPCHIITALQIYFLAAEKSKTVIVLFRIHLHLIFGPFLAMVFPVVNTRILPGEVAVYWIQHILIVFIIPPYLISKGGCFTPEPLNDYSWSMLSLVVFATHMFVFLQGIGMLTLVNLNSMLCPAISDPFYGPYYRWFAMVHQSILVLFFGKLYTFVILHCLKKFREAVKSSKKTE